MIHEKGFSISVDNGQFVFLDPSGRRIDAVPIRPEVAQADLATLWEHDKLSNIDAETNEPLYDGEPIQMQHIIDALLTAANDPPN